jgi:hypothetical protein
MDLQKSEKVRGRKRPIRLSTYGANWDQHGFNAPEDWRYDAYLDFLKLSPSYRMVYLYHQGRVRMEDLPPDRDRLIQIYQDFGDYKTVSSDDWWVKRGMKLFGIKAPTAEVKVVGALTQQTTPLTLSRNGHDALVMTVPLSLTRAEVMKKVKKALSDYEFALPASEDVAPKYTLNRSKLQKRKLYDAHDALRWYLQGKPLWQIGVDLHLVPTQYFDYKKLKAEALRNYSSNKTVLAAAASREVRKALFIAENSARGIFPSDKPVTDYFDKAWNIDIGAVAFSDGSERELATRRKAGRPRKQS